MYLVKTPKFIQKLFPNFTWSIPTQEKVIYLTFDDGPIPEITPWVLDTLAAFDAKATFFCVGNNVAQYPEVYKQVLAEGHSVGNHTNQHKNGWASEYLPYLHDVGNCSKLVDSNLFRPPYGRLKPSQAQFLQRDYRIILWDVLSGDFDQQLDPRQCLSNVILKTEPGSIVVFHDSLKAERNLKFTLPKFLAHFTKKGYRFEALKQQQAHKISKAS